MSDAGFHLTPIGSNDFLLEPSPSLDVGAPDPLILEIVGRLQKGKSSRLYYDLADLPVIDLVYYAWLNRLARACRAINVQMVGVHMQPTAAFALSQRLPELPQFKTALDVKERP